MGRNTRAARRLVLMNRIVIRLAKTWSLIMQLFGSVKKTKVIPRVEVDENSLIILSRRQMKRKLRKMRRKEKRRLRKANR